MNLDEHYEEMTKAQLIVALRNMREDLATERAKRIEAMRDANTRKFQLEAASFNHRNEIAALRGSCVPYGYECNGLWCTNCNSQVDREDTYCSTCGCLLDWDGEVDA